MAAQFGDQSLLEIRSLAMASSEQQQQKIADFDARLYSASGLASSSDPMQIQSLVANDCLQDAKEQNTSCASPSLSRPRPQRRNRTNFTPEQLRRLEAEFLSNQYPDIGTREDLAEEFGISEARIQVWFQNHRARARRRNKMTASSSTESPSSSPALSKRSIDSPVPSRAAIDCGLSNPNCSPPLQHKLYYSNKPTFDQGQGVTSNPVSGHPDKTSDQSASQSYYAHPNASLVLAPFPQTQAMTGFIPAQAHSNGVYPLLRSGYSWTMPTHGQTQSSPVLGPATPPLTAFAHPQTSPQLVIAATQPWQRMGGLQLRNSIA